MVEIELDKTQGRCQPHGGLARDAGGRVVVTDVVLAASPHGAERKPHGDCLSQSSSSFAGNGRLM